MFDLGSTARAIDSPPGHPKPGLRIKYGQIPDEALLDIVNLVNQSAAAAASEGLSFDRPELNPNFRPGAAGALLKPLDFANEIAFPLTEESDRLEIGHGSLLHIWSLGRSHDIAVLPLSMLRI
jgi:hypothetical protein